MFGVANQLLAAVALCVATTTIINMGKARYAWTTLVPLAFVGTTTLVAGWMSIRDIFIPLTRNPKTATQGYVDAALTAILMAAAVIILFDSIRRWTGARRRPEPTGRTITTDEALANAPS
jgi:carbon starvation protein